jgi:hypothetical protein
MVFNPTAGIVVGVRLTRHIEAHEVIKYNEDTGKPYKVANDFTTWRLGETDIEIDRAEYEGGVKDKLGVYYTGHYENAWHFLGMLPVSVDAMPHEGEPCVELQDIEPARRRAAKLLYELGYLDAVGVFLINGLGY